MFGVCDSEIKCQSEMLLHNHVTNAPLPRPLYPLIKHTRGSTRLMCQTACADCLISYESDSRACVFVSKSAGSFVYGERKRKVNTCLISSNRAVILFVPGICIYAELDKVNHII